MSEQDYAVREMNSEESKRYSRNLLLPELGLKGQIQLLESSVLVIGAGALGTACSMYLAGSGVGRIGLVDYDKVDISNLQRQPAFSTSDIGRPKASILARRLQEINPHVMVDVMKRSFTPEEGPHMVEHYDLVIEASDSPQCKYDVTDCCDRVGKAYVLGGVEQWRGQLMSHIPGSVTYRDWFPQVAEKGHYVPSSEGGILGPLPGILGAAMAAEAIKILTGTATALVDSLWTLDTRDWQSKVIRMQ